MDSLEIEVDVNEAYIARVRPAQPVEAVLDAYPDWTIPARVITTIPTADRQKATVQVRIGFIELDPRILPDMGVKVAFRETREADDTPVASIRVPTAVLRREQDRDVVFVVHGDRVERRAVSALIVGDTATISAGLRAGERVVAEGPPDLADGQRVELR
jgi:multidrug efflux pump subunit AcrA (membrane-fusion protein)